jgi:hypothetical protein
LKIEEYLTVLITFGKYKLEFARVHSLAFKADWIVGIDKKPFSEEFISPEEAKTAKRVYYIKFSGEPGTRLIIMEQNK